jgi:predicted phage terminase large subunit-like protein
MMLDPSLIEELEILEELDKRRSREDFLAFYLRMTGFQPPRHVRLICRLIQSMEEDLIDRAMVFAPPRHAKTLLCTKLAPAWIMGRHPSAKLMSVVHTADFAGKTGRAVRNLLRHPAWPFDGVCLAEDSQARDQWATPQGGEYNGFGATAGNQHGNPAEWLFMDDLVKGRKIAMSPNMRQDIWENYTTDLVSRLEGRAKQLMVFTRWHQDDPAGRILGEDFDGRTGWHKDRTTGEPWYVLCLPAVAERDDDPLNRAPGEWLWPERFGEDRLGGRRKRGGWVWSALYQQRPSPEEGLMFTKEHIARFDWHKIDRTRLQFYIASDYAVTAEGESAEDPDYTVHMVWAVDPEHNIYLMDIWRGRTSSDAWVMAWIKLVLKWKPLRAFEEAGQILKSVGPLIKIMMQKHRAFTDRVQLTSTTDKATRAQALLGMAAMGMMYLPEHSTFPAHARPHLDAFERELLQFPTAKHDDTVDAATLFGRGIHRVITGAAPGRKSSSPHDDTLDDLFSRHDEEMDRRERQ